MSKVNGQILLSCPANTSEPGPKHNYLKIDIF
jgi:hypothetical protein